MSSVKGRCCTDIRLLRLARIPRFSFDLLATFFCEIFFLSAETHRWTRLYVGIAALFFFGYFWSFSLHLLFVQEIRSTKERGKNNNNNNLEEKKRNNEIPKENRRMKGEPHQWLR
jgi:hypothetical protein